MNATKHYQIKEFADMAGVTVRTLQYYDRIGVLEPTNKTDAQHRLYVRNDLLKLQQILTLKQLGFTLKEIKDMIQRPEYDLRSAMQAQKQAIDAQITQLQQVSSAMEHAMDVLDTTENWDWDTVQFIIQGVTDKHYLDWIRTYFSDEQITTIAEMSRNVPIADIKDGYTKWQAIAETLHQNQHLPPEHPTLQAVAQDAHDLVQSFTQGNADIHESLVEMYNHPDDIPPAYRIFDDDLFAFYRQVMDVFYQNQV